VLRKSGADRLVVAANEDTEGDRREGEADNRRGADACAFCGRVRAAKPNAAKVSATLRNFLSSLGISRAPDTAAAQISHIIVTSQALTRVSCPSCARLHS
jgi:hypothetical protein